MEKVILTNVVAYVKVCMTKHLDAMKCPVRIELR